MFFNSHKPFNPQTILLAVMVCLLCATSYAQTASFKNYSVKDGLPSSEVYSAMQDSKGYMWFATDKGVSRFDGYRFHNYSTVNGLADNTIFECVEDPKGRIWFRSFSGKLSYYYNDSIYKLSVNDTLSKIIKSSYPVSLVVDSNDNLYLGTYSLPAGIIKIDLKRNKLYTIPLPYNKTYIVYIGNNILIGNTYVTGFKTENKSEKTYLNVDLYKLNQNGQRIIHLKTIQSPDINNAVTVHDNVLKIGKDTLALSISNHFLLIDTATSKIELVKNFNDQNILSINKGLSSRIWLSTEDTLICYSKENTYFQQPYFFSKKNITSVTQDKEHGIWFTTLYGGVYYLNSLSFKIYTTDNGLAGNKTSALAIAENGTIWQAAENSNIISIIRNNEIKHLVISLAKKYFITSILISKDSSIWVSSSAGLTIIKKNNIQKLFIPGKTDLYTIINNNDGISWANEYVKLDMIKQQDNNLTITDLVNCGSKIFCMSKDSDGSIWLGTLKGLLHYIHDTLVNYGNKNPIFKNRINDLKIYPDGDLWIATRDTGIIIKHGNKIIRITTQDGILSNFCQCLCIDYKGNIWVGSNLGISHIILNKNNSPHLIDTIINITAPELIEVNILKSNHDTIYAATSNGLTLFDMNKVSSNKVPPAVYITGIKINNQNKYISSAYNLKYDENYLIINFVGLTYKDAGNTQYRYKMEGIDTGWVYTKNRDVQYPKLPPGNYTFLVSAMNNDGVWNQHPASVKFYISPPFWATWWARSIFILAIAGFIFWRFRIVTNRAKKEAEINKHLISMELKELKAQMDPHFLFNNLNTLTQLVEIKSDDAPEFVEELSRYYRYSLQFRNTEFTTLDNELKQAERYLHILKIRFGDNIHVTWNIRDELKNYYVATYSMQLLLENITKHNIVSASKPIWVNINTNTDGYLEVKNQYQPKNSSALSNKHGLKSIEQRYQLLISKNINITQNSEVFSVQLPLISPTQYENIYS